jgi:hypothetical protein
VAFASLTAADFSANDQLARMLGENEFGALFHQEKKTRSTWPMWPGRLFWWCCSTTGPRSGWSSSGSGRGGGAVGLFTEMFARESAGDRRMETGFVGEAEDEIDKLFGS